MPNKNVRTNIGFTLVEVLVAIAVIMTLFTGAVLIINPKEQRLRARNTGIIATLNELSVEVGSFILSRQLQTPTCQDLVGTEPDCAGTLYSIAECTCSQTQNEADFKVANVLKEDETYSNFAYKALGGIDYCLSAQAAEEGEFFVYVSGIPSSSVSSLCAGTVLKCSSDCHDPNLATSLSTCKTLEDLSCAVGPGGAICGNGVCESGETATSCPTDCSGGPGPSEPVCGNSICEVGETSQTCPSDCIWGPGTDSPFAMEFYSPGPKGHVCEYPIIAVSGKHLKNKNGDFDPGLLDEAQACGTKVMVFLIDSTDEVVGDAGGLDLTKFRNKIEFFDEKIDPYVDSGVIIVHGVVDEPHDCNNDWNGVCPLPSDVDAASDISKEYWPNLPTSVNTVPNWLESQGYTFNSIDIVQFQFAFHKYNGDYQSFVDDAVALRDSGMFSKLSWALQVAAGGCSQYGGCPMSPDQVREVSAYMCGASLPEWAAFVYYQTSLFDNEMLLAIQDMQTYCAP